MFFFGGSVKKYDLQGLYTYRETGYPGGMPGAAKRYFLHIRFCRCVLQRPNAESVHAEHPPQYDCQNRNGSCLVSVSNGPRHSTVLRQLLQAVVHVKRAAAALHSKSLWIRNISSLKKTEEKTLEAGRDAKMVRRT